MFIISQPCSVELCLYKVKRGNFGYNGSENFRSGHRFGFFPAIALGWTISNEKF